MKARMGALCVMMIATFVGVLESRAQVAFVEAPLISADADRAFSVFPADLDGDGDLDIAAAAFDTAASPDISWYENDGFPPFPRRSVESTPGFRSEIAAADMDNDGDIDLVSVGDSVVLHLNNGGGSGATQFTNITLPSDPNNTAVFEVFIADVNNDGANDVLGSATNAGRVFLYTNDGNDPPGFTRTEAAAFTFAGDLHAADLNGDGFIDFAVEIAFSGFDQLGVALNTGPPNYDFVELPNFSASGIDTDALQLFIADADDDGDEDVLLGAASTLLLFRNDGASPFTLTPVQLLGPESEAFFELFAADLDGDEATDLLTARGNFDDFDPDFFAGFTKRPLTPPFDEYDPISGLTLAAPGAAAFFSPIAVDLDADGDTDVIVGDEGAGVSGGIRYFRQEALTSVRLISPTTAGPTPEFSNFASAIAAAQSGDTLFTSPAVFGSAVAIDLDGLALTLRSNGGIDQPEGGEYTLADGARIETSDSRTIELGGSSVPLATIEREGVRINGGLVVPANATATLATSSVASGPTSTVTLGNDAALDMPTEEDVVLAGGLDLGANASMTTGGSLHLEGADVSFASSPVFVPPSGSLFRDAAAADFNGDSATDLVTAIDPAGLRVHISDGAATPTFAAFPTSLFDRVTAVGVADIDSSGTPDIVAVSRSTGAVYVLYNDGQPVPSFAVNTPVTLPGPTDIATGDLDADGDPDLVVATQFGQPLVWLENLDGVSFVQRIVSASAAGAESLRIADVDTDGDMDIVASSETLDAAMWFESTGGATPSFSTRTIANGLIDISSIAVADVDGDGDIDAATTSLDGVLRWHESNGAMPPTFVTRFIAAQAEPFRDLSIIDIDGDGSPDIAAGGDGEQALQVFFSNGAANPTFERVRASSTPGEALLIAPAFIDADTTPDLVTGFSNGRVTWYALRQTTSIVREGATVTSGGAISIDRTVELLGGRMSPAAVGIDITGALVGFGSLDGSVVNAGSLAITGDTSANGDLLNDGSIEIAEGVLTVLVDFTCNGALLADFTAAPLPLTDIPINGLHVGGRFVATGEADVLVRNALLRIGEALRIELTTNQSFDLSHATVLFDGLNATLEAASEDIGPDLAGFNPATDGAFPLGVLRVAPSSTTTLVDDVLNDVGPAGVPAAVYVDHLIVEANATLSTNGIPIYVRRATIDGAVDDKELVIIVDACPGDATGDRRVDGADLVTVLSNFGQPTSGGPESGDVAPPGAPDGFVNGADLVEVLANFGVSCKAGVAGDDHDASVPSLKYPCRRS